MDPQQQYQPGPTAQPPMQPGQYDFITNPQKPPRRGLLGGGKNSLLALIAGGLGLLTLLVIIASLIFGGSDNKDVLLEVARKQNQIIEISKIGTDEGGSAETRALGEAVGLSLTSEQQAVLAKVGKVKSKDYAMAPSSEDLKTLETAQQNGRFDEVFANIIKQELTEYQQVLRSANNQVSGQSTKDVLAKNFEDAGLLLQIPK